MARPPKNRKLDNPPVMQGFKPFGIPICEMETLILKYEEYEAFKLLNYDNLSQEEAAEKMSISRPTVTRIYNKALKIIAQAFAEGKAVEIEGGNYEFTGDWYRCRKCYKLIQGIENHTKCADCKSFGENELIPVR